MSLEATAFVGFDASAAAAALRRFDSSIKRRGAAYYHDGHVSGIDCLKPGVAFVARVQGSNLYEVNLAFDRKAKRWQNDCTCPVGADCKHAYAALQQLVAEHAKADVHSLSSGATTRSVKAKPAVPPPPPTFSEVVMQKLDRPLEPHEAQYLRAVRAAYNTARTAKVLFVRDLQPFGVEPAGGWWDRLDLWTEFPQSEAEFWNHLANYLEEQRVGFPEFLEPVTNVEKNPRPTAATSAEAGN